MPSITTKTLFRVQVQNTSSLNYYLYFALELRKSCHTKSYLLRIACFLQAGNIENKENTYQLVSNSAAILLIKLLPYLLKVLALAV